VDAIDRLMGVSPAALSIRARRLELISANLANADTPGYKAVDIDFGQALGRAMDERAGRTAVREGHIALGSGGADATLMYRNPAQHAIDGNTVETEQEHAAFMDNAIRYQASLNFLDGRVKSVIMALRGE